MVSLLGEEYVARLRCAADGVYFTFRLDGL